MSARQIDESLSLWKQRLDAAAQNLLDLQSHPVYKRISAPDSHLAGETAEKSAFAVRTLGWLLQFFDLLQGVIARAEDLRRDMPALFGAEEREREIGALLRGRSIQLPAAHIPLGQRSLSGGAENTNTISPSDLLATMESSFEELKQIVLRLDTAWESLGRGIEEASRNLAILQETATDLDEADQRMLGQAAQRLQTASQFASEDPLGNASQAITQINEGLQRIGAKLDQLRRDRAQAHSELAGAAQFLESLKNDRDVLRAMCAEAREKTGFVSDLHESDRRWEGLSLWLDRLRGAGEGAAPGALLVGLRNWTQAARQAAGADRAALEQARAQLSLRAELRGRLGALKAKARAYSVAENDSLAAIAARAKDMLYRRPTPLEEAASSVAEYEAKLNSETAKAV